MRKRQSSESQSEISHDDEDSMQQIAPQGALANIPRTERAKRTNLVQRNYQHDFSESEQSESDDPNEYIYFNGGRISKVLAQRKRSGTKVTEKLCKFRQKSYLHLQWITDEEAKAKEIQMLKMTEKMRSAMINNLQQIKEKFGKEHYFNPAFTRVDRILSRAVLFPIMHHKKGSEMNGKWSQMMMLVCSKILNFQKDNVPYGIIEKDDFHPEFIDETKSQNKIKIQHIINRVYLDKYKTPELFWKDVGESIRAIPQFLPDQGAQKDAQILKQCIVFLYWQWFCLSRQRFLTFLPKIPLYDKIKNDLENQDCQVQFKFASDCNEFNFENEMLKQNIFIRQNYAQIPTEEKQLLPLHPGKFTYNWLTSEMQQKDYTKTTFQHLNADDIKILDLNVEVDHLYLVKWCDLDYEEVTWEKQSDLKCSEKIQNYKQYSKIPSKKDREKFEENKRHHKAILSSLLNEANKEPIETVQRYRKKLYHLYPTTKQIKQYGGQDIPVYKGYKLLKNFQLEGLNWLIRSWHQKRNCILADEMGLGKTIQTIAFLNYLNVLENVIGPFLVVAPVSTLKQWRNQIEQWSDLNCVLYKGKKQSRQLIEEFEFYHKFVTNEGILVKFQKLPRFQVLLTNFEVFTSDIETFQKLSFQHIIIDEAQKIKNANTKLARFLKQLPCPRILLLTGTPIQNSTADIFGLLNFIEPRKFSSLEQFKGKFGNLRTAEEIKQLKQVLKPYMMRRVKSDVQKSIPKLSEMVVSLELSSIQRLYYRGIIQKNKNQLLSSLNNAAMNNIAQCFRRCCNHPYLLSDTAEEEITSKCLTDQQRFDQFINSSIKMTFVHKFLSKCKEEGTKTLIFSQYLDMLALLKQYCLRQSILFEMLDGRVDYEQRQNRIDRFNNQKDVLVFIISTKAGGVGINLTSATNIIIYDSDWNPQNDIQAIARAHRIGQHKNVTVYRLVTTNTYEESIYMSAVRKLGMGIAILDNDYFNNQQGSGRDKGKEKTKQEIQKLLKEGIGGFLMNQKSKQQAGGNNIQNLTIEDIIAKSCTSVQYQTKDCSFTSTKFESSEKIDPDARNYWQVALQQIQSPLQKLTKKLKNQQEAQRIFESPQDQLALMIEANNIVYEFVKSKVSMSHFNAQDERDLRNFLEKITYARQFQRQFKSIANDWLEEIEKPSRRFDKYDINKLKEVVNSKTETRRISRTKPKKSLTDAISSEENKSSPKLSQNSNENEQLQQLSQEEPEQQQEEKKPVNIRQSKNRKNMDESSMEEELKQQKEQGPEKKEKRQPKVLPKDPKSFEQTIKGNLHIFLEKACALCQRKVCSKICKGRCKRSFHEKCYEYFTQGQNVPICPVKIEQKLNKKELTDALSEPFQCIECKRSQSKCFLCNKVGEAIVSSWVQKGLKKPIRFSNDPHSRNQIEGLFKSLKQHEKKLLYQCRMEYCTKTYHLECLMKIKDQFQFEIFGNLDARSYPLKCPCHFCLLCKKKLTFVKASCLLCPASYHLKCKPHNESEFYEIDHEMFICKKHMSAEEIEIRTREQQEEKSYAILKPGRIEQKKAKKLKKKLNCDEEPSQKQTTGMITEKIQEAFKSVEEVIQNQRKDDCL